MRTYRFTQPRGSQLIAFLVEDTHSGQQTGRLYSAEELYPLVADRYANNLPNLFLDLLDLLDGQEPWEGDNSGQDGLRRAESAPSVSLRSLCKRAARAAADGSGNARRFADARDLWDKLEAHLLSRLIQPDQDPITDVRKTKNWRKNQPFADTRADPTAWFVSTVFSRSNQQKNPFQVYRGLDAVLDPDRPDLDEPTQAAVAQARTAAADNLNFPSYAQVSELVGDSNMLVFHDHLSLAAWIRDEVTRKEFVYASTPVNLHQAKGPSLIPASLVPAAVSAAPTVTSTTPTASNLANKLSPRAKKG